MLRHLRPAGWVFVTLAAALAVVLVGRAAPQTASTAERFSATAVNFDAPAGAVATPIEILVERWSSNAERERLITTILESGQDRALEVLQKLPRIGSIRSTTSLGYDLRFAQHTPGPNGTDRIVIMTDRP